MTADIPFLERSDYMSVGVRKFEVFCPLTETDRKKKSKSGTPRRVSGDDGADIEPETKERSALAVQYCPKLHKMIGYMRRLDGAYPNTSKGLRIMDPLAPDGEPKWATGGRTNPLFGWWTFYAWRHVFFPIFEKVMGPIVNVNEAADVDRLLEVEVMV